jgi:hypothetical protein
MSKKPVKKKESTALTAEKSPDAGRELTKKALKCTYYNNDSMFEKAFDLIKMAKESRKKRAKATDELSGELGRKLIDSLSLATNALPNLATNESYRPFLNEFIYELQKEYKVKTASEKSIVQMASLSFVQFLKYSNLFNVNAPVEWGDNSPFLSVLSKEADRAHRRFVSCLQLLKNIKEPPLKVNVKAQNAFVAQNQQINSQPENENNKK